MKKYIISPIVILVLLFVNISTHAQHYTDWTGFEYSVIGDKLYELQKDYTISLPEYYSDDSKLPSGMAQHLDLFHEWVEHTLPICDWDFIRLEEDGIITVKKGYRWDGPSYLLREHSYFDYRSSMIHDALYDLMRMGYMQADYNHDILICSDRHDMAEVGDVNRLMADMMIYMIAVEDGQSISGAQGAKEDFDNIRLVGACETYNEDLLADWKYHVSEFTAIATNSAVELFWKLANDAGKDPNFETHFSPYNSYYIQRSDGYLMHLPVLHADSTWRTSVIDRTVDNGTAYTYQIMPDPTNGNQYDWSNMDVVVPMSGAGNALKLDGANDYMEANTVSNDLLYSPIIRTAPIELTIEAWVYPEDHNSRTAVFAFNTITGRNSNMLFYDGEEQKFLYYDPKVGGKYFDIVTPADQWYHIAITIDSLNQAILYVDGIEIVIFATSKRPVHGDRFSVGQEWDYHRTSQHFKGMIDELRIWNIARSQSQIIDDINQPLRGDEPGIVALWHFDEPNDMILKTTFDATRNANDGYLNNYNNSDNPFIPSGAMQIPTAVDDDNPEVQLPNKFALAQNYPNPFNPSTNISYSLPTRADVTITIYNILGQEISTLVNEYQPAGKHWVRWHGDDYNGDKLSTGIYFYRIHAGDFTGTKKMLLLK